MSVWVTVAVLFVILGGATVAILGGAVWAITEAMIEGTEAGWMAAAVYGSLSAVAVVGMVTAAWLFFHLRFVRPLRNLTRFAQSLSRLDFEGAVEPAAAHTLGSLAEAVRDLGEKLRDMPDEMRKAVSNATARAEETRIRLEAILFDLSEGVLVCNLEHQILLYNQAAARLLRTPEKLGLGRSLFGLLTREPVLHTLERLTYQLSESHAQVDHSAMFICATSDARTLLQSRMNLIRDTQEVTTGYVLTFVDAGHDIAALAMHDALLRAATEGMRSTVANLRAAVESLAAHPGLLPDERAPFEAIITAETAVLSGKLDDLASEYGDLSSRRWPMADVHSTDLLSCVIRHLRETTRIEVTMVGMPLWLRVDSYSLMHALEYLIRCIHEATGVVTFDVEALLGDRRVYLDIIWQGSPVASHILDIWTNAPLNGMPGGLMLRDVLDRHGSELWSQEQRRGYALLRIPLPAPLRPQFMEVRIQPPRPEFYDFDLLHQIGTAGEAFERPLRDLTYVVFDTETTGLRPSEGDEMVSIGGVRIVNGRILAGETFHRLVNPGRPIPPRSTRFHGITDDMVRDAPPANVVLPQFKRFVEDAVLVAHNAAFDMKFLKLKEPECGVRFDNAVLDTLLLSAYLHEHTLDHDLDSITARFGIAVADRHTALGDAMATAGVFVRMIELLESRHVITLQQALEAANSMIELRKQQAKFFG